MHYPKRKPAGFPHSACTATSCLAALSHERPQDMPHQRRQHELHRSATCLHTVHVYHPSRWLSQECHFTAACIMAVNRLQAIQFQPFICVHGLWAIGLQPLCTTALNRPPLSGHSALPVATDPVDGVHANRVGKTAVCHDFMCWNCCKNSNVLLQHAAAHGRACC